jgi:hypothetical protein
MKVGASRGQLYDAQKSSRAIWDSTREMWTDDARREFEDRVWIPLDASVSNALRAIDQLSVLFAQVRKDCEFQS